ncbi:hypothetical protein cyc_03852 [Cyclospora cayetanensis]|uniref:Uncharacterized protein n=1 Tax=Cyclospora cayetanensis TaxID=88456 RepID=A0A1D3D9D2_9EIME|nr:hypothetical protein cyc_03852 [Cyclospora cayetanensis]
MSTEDTERRDEIKKEEEKAVGVRKKLKELEQEEQQLEVSFVVGQDEEAQLEHEEEEETNPKETEEAFRQVVLRGLKGTGPTDRGALKTRKSRFRNFAPLQPLMSPGRTFE